MNKNIVCYGEVLWDVLPDMRLAGGAPMNVAIRLRSLGCNSSIISRTGNDAAGEELLQLLKDKNVSTHFVQTDNNYPTGEVLVKLNDKGVATYDIVYPSAWDKIENNPAAAAAVKEAAAFVFGSLVCRDEVSKATLLSLLDEARYKVFDVNLRPPFYSVPLLQELINHTDLLKLNDEELGIIASSFGCASSNPQVQMRFLARWHHEKTVCVTRGDKGAMLLLEDKVYSHPGFSVAVVDTIGSGDSFLAALIFKLLSGIEPEEALTYACAMGAAVAMHAGANPDVNPEALMKQ